MATLPPDPLSPEDPVPSGLTPIERGQIGVLRVEIGIIALVLTIAATGLGAALYAQLGTMAAPWPLIVVPLLLTAVVKLPKRRWRHWGYAMEEERLRVVRGMFFRTDTVVPFNRVQHIDVAQGPVERYFGVAKLVVHTAGTHNSTVELVGLKPETAAAMRETMRQHIRQEMI